MKSVSARRGMRLVRTKLTPRSWRGNGAPVDGAVRMALGESLLLYGLGAGAAAAFGLPALKSRLELSRAKHRSLAGHARLARRVAALVPGYAHGEDRFFSVDGAPAEDRAPPRRIRAALCPLSHAVRAHAGGDREREGSPVRSSIHRRLSGPVPVQRACAPAPPVGAFLAESAGPILEDLDGNRFYDLAGLRR